VTSFISPDNLHARRRPETPDCNAIPRRADRPERNHLPDDLRGLGGNRAHLALLLVAAATLAAGGVLAIVALHAVTD